MGIAKAYKVKASDTQLKTNNIAELLAMEEALKIVK
jgi:hypothetical protein